MNALDDKISIEWMVVAVDDKEVGYIRRERKQNNVNSLIV